MVALLFGEMICVGAKPSGLNNGRWRFERRCWKPGRMGKLASGKSSDRMFTFGLKSKVADSCFLGFCLCCCSGLSKRPWKEYFDFPLSFVICFWSQEYFGFYFIFFIFSV